MSTTKTMWTAAQCWPDFTEAMREWRDEERAEDNGESSEDLERDVRDASQRGFDKAC